MNLTLPITAKYYDLIYQGIKKEEYREIKSHWVSRLCCKPVDGIVIKEYHFKSFSTLTLINGYSRNARTMVLKWEGVDIGKPNPDWCDGWNQDVFRIKIGEILEVKNHEI